MSQWQPVDAEIPQGLRHDVVRRNEQEIAQVMDWAADICEADPGSPLAKFAHGVSDGIAWLLGQSEDNPRDAG